MIKKIILIFLFTFHADVFAAKQMTLTEAIMLAVRDNPNVRIGRMNYTLDKFNTYVQEWNFAPHYGFQGSVTTSNNRVAEQPFTSTSTINIQPSVSLNNHYGTNFILSGTNTTTSHYNPGLSLQISQPLIRGFGKPIVDMALENARDSQTITLLSMEETLRSTISQVIAAYLDVVNATKRLEIDKKALARAEKSVEQTKLFIKAGHKAGNELVTVQANVASSKAQLENDKNTLMQTRYGLLTAIGLDPYADIEFVPLDLADLIEKYKLPSLQDTKQKTLANDIQYQVDQITLKGSKTRALLQAKDNARWKLDLSASIATGQGAGGGVNSGLNSLFNGANQSTGATLTLEIPIDNKLNEQAIMGAKMALKEALLQLRYKKYSIETNAINGWNSVVSAKRSLQYAKDAEALQEKTYQLNYQKYIHGLIDSLELQSAQANLIQAQQSYLSSQIEYIKSLVSLDKLIGHTLKTWQVAVRTR